MQAVWVSMAVFALAGSISPGPVNVIASALGATQGFVRALPHVLGATLSYCAVVWLMGNGLQVLLALYPQIAQTTQYAGAVYLLYLAARIAGAPPRVSGAEGPGVDTLSAWTQGLLQGVLTQSLNPKAWLVALSGVSLFVPEGPDSAARLVMFCAISGVVCFVSVAAWAALGRLIRRWLAHAPYQRLFNRALAALLVFTVYSMLAQAG
ncbi:LysE family translocator [Rhodoferax sp. AJA081-3]|uniref:LysE family translocator n=1 Tax=Rhodoferax sp. AJA081-3 TaxID=2752316 RepID=UPI001ADFFEC3|nr:LysE family translocator [Rhodoferax sp. AJA081-3]QTN29438.1 LysE family translocator [Rhodoferax sp. AJA081-3]